MANEKLLITTHKSRPSRGPTIFFSSFDDFEFLRIDSSHGEPRIMSNAETERAWLVEITSITGVPRWYSMRAGWTTDSLLATRFSRKQDADDCIDLRELHEHNAKATEHIWNAPQEDTASSKPSAGIVDTSDVQVALMCMYVARSQANPNENWPTDWRKRVNDLIRTLRDERNDLRKKLVDAVTAPQQ